MKPDPTLGTWLCLGGPRRGPPASCRLSASHRGGPSCPPKARPSPNLMAGAHRPSNSFSIILQMETLRLQKSDLGLDVGLPAPHPGLLLPSGCRHRPLGQGEHSMWTGLRGPLTSSRRLSRPPNALSLSVLTYEMNTVLPAYDTVERFRAVRSWSWHMAGNESVFVTALSCLLPHVQGARGLSRWCGVASAKCPRERGQHAVPGCRSSWGPGLMGHNSPVSHL